jgi:hypothetical protein
MTWSQQLYFPSTGSRATDFYHSKPGLYWQTVGPLASTVTITPLRMTHLFTSIVHAQLPGLKRFSVCFLQCTAQVVVSREAMG